MHKDTKWAHDIISLQDHEGKWGCFHSLSQFYNSPITTEQALRRLERLGYTIEDKCIQKAVSYMSDCLVGKKTIPDRVEKVGDWNTFTSLMLATWIRRFTYDNSIANEVAEKWGRLVSSSFIGGRYSQSKYELAYRDILGLKPRGGRLIDFVNFYPISLLKDCFDAKTQIAFVDYLLNHDSGIYYIYGSKLSILPECFESKKASQYLAAIELLADYTKATQKLDFVVEWLKDNRNENEQWDMGKSVNDKIYFPLSNDWRKIETRQADCTKRITRLLHKLET